MESTALWGVLATMAHEAISNGNSSNEILLPPVAPVCSVGPLPAASLATTPPSPESRVRYLDLGGLTGALVAGGIYASFEPKDAPAYLTQGIIAGHRRRVVHRFSTHPRREYASARAVKRLATSTCSHENTRWQLALSQLGYVLSGLD